jgi:hypothetical protein
MSEQPCIPRASSEPALQSQRGSPLRRSRPPYPSCNQPAMPNGRCRLHGGKSTGPRTFEGLERMRKAKITHGARTAEMEQVRKMIRDLKAGAKRLAERV